MSPYPFMMFTSLPAIKAVIIYLGLVYWLYHGLQICLPHFREFQDPKMEVVSPSLRPCFWVVVGAFNESVPEMAKSM